MSSSESEEGNDERLARDYAALRNVNLKEFAFYSYPLEQIVEVKNGRIDHQLVADGHRFNFQRPEDGDDVNCFVCPTFELASKGRKLRSSKKPGSLGEFSVKWPRNEKADVRVRVISRTRFVCPK